MYVCMYIYTLTFIYYTHTHTHTHTERERERERERDQILVKCPNEVKSSKETYYEGKRDLLRPK